MVLNRFKRDSRIAVITGGIVGADGGRISW